MNIVRFKKDDTCLNLLMWKKIRKRNVVGKLFVVSFEKNFIFHKYTFGLTVEGIKRKEYRKSAIVLWVDDMTVK